VVNAKLILVMGHTRCGAVTTALSTYGSNESPERTTGCAHLGPVLREIQESIDVKRLRGVDLRSAAELENATSDLARVNVRRTVNKILESSETIRRLAAEGRVLVVGALYDVATGELEFLTSCSEPLHRRVEAIGESA
jgi:carbonic anhydrase/SulP family sulfate permease